MPAGVAHYLLLGTAVAGLAACRQPTAIAPPPDRRLPVTSDCARPAGFAAAAQINASSLRALEWEPFRRPETGWEVYAPAVSREIGATCPPQTPGFAAALARWQARRQLPVDGLFSGVAFQEIKGLWQERRPFVMATRDNQCPTAPDEATLVPAALEEGYGRKPILLRPGALDAYRRMRDAARRDLPGLADDPQLLTIFSGYRSAASDDARCVAEGNCQGITRARCSAHRTGLAVDLTLEPAPGLRPDDSADANRLHMTQSPLYGWLLANAGRFGFVNYLFEPWHWEWTGEPLGPPGPPLPPLPPAAPALPAAPPGTNVPSERLSSQNETAEPEHDREKPDPKRVAADPDGGLQPRSEPGPAAKSAPDAKPRPKSGKDRNRPPLPDAGRQRDL